ncbi:MAG: glycosyltransferase family 4 protein, partial [Acidobacteria bacterium]|nr:glycosyltransferase family 4 protein [Acidobacteriota bacterium]
MSRSIILFGPLPPPYGGVAIYMKALVGHLRKYANVSVWTYGGARITDARVRFIAHRRLGTLWAGIAEGRRARILDASHFHLEYPNPLLLPVWILLKHLLRFDWYKNVHDGSLPERHRQFSRTQRWLFRRAIKAVDEFVVVSEDLKRWLEKEIGVRQPITIIPSLLPNPPGNSEARLSSTTEALIKPYLAHTKRICSVGVFFPSYGFKDIAEALEQLRWRTKADIGLILVDGAFVRDEQYRRETLSKRDWITVLEEVPNPDLHEILKRSDVFVRAFADESYGIARVEAIWCGIPVVATRAGETRGMLLYDFGNEEELIGQLNNALVNPTAKDTSAWAERYRREAEQNLRAVIE